MNNKLLIWLYMSCFFVQAQEKTFVSFQQKSTPSVPTSVYEVEVNDGSYYFIFLDDKTIETSFIKLGERYISRSHAIVMPTKFPNSQKAESNNKIELKHQDLKIIINKNPFEVAYFYKNKLIVKENKGFYKKPHEVMEHVKGNIVADSVQVMSLTIDSNEKLYGGGARALGMDRRGHKLALFNRAHYGYETESSLMNFCMPVVLSSNKYLIHFDNPSVGYLNLDEENNNELSFETTSGKQTYQIMVGDNWKDLIETYSKFTGTQPMLPMWALGNFASRFGYRSEQETKAVVNQYKQDNIPLDAVILDLFWFGKTIQGTMGNLAVDRDSFPNWEQMIGGFNNQGIKTIPITEPFILTSSNRWKEAVEEDVLAKNDQMKPYTYDFYFGNTGLIDVFKPKAKQWFWNIYKDLADTGVAGVWGDLGEPEVHPHDILHWNGDGGAVHNIYGNEWAKLVFDGYKRDFPKTRPFILMRSGYSGAQRFGMVPWSGDVNRTWGGLQKQVEISLQMGLQGMGYMHSDLGGFAGANLDDELYVRWLQYGVFNPIFRPHAQEEVPSEPVFRSTFAKALAKEAIELRYQLLPYNYQLMYENHTKGLPLMRPLFFEESNNDKLLTFDDGYLWGNDFLVYPIKEAAQSVKKIYFPKGSRWFNFYNNEVFDGGSEIDFTLEALQVDDNNILLSPKTNNYHIPTYVRGGSFVAMTKVIQNTTEFDKNNLDVHFYYDKSLTESERSFYFDDGLNAKAIEKGRYEHLICSYEKNKKCISLTFKTKLGNHQPLESKKINLIVHGFDKKPKRLRINNKKVKFDWNKEKQLLIVTVNHVEKVSHLIIK